MAEDLYKSITIGDETFVIKKFTAITGLQIAKLLITKAEPMIPMLENGLEKEDNLDEMSDALVKLAESISDEELNTLVNKCLRYVYKQFPAGLQPVVDRTGNYGVDGVEYDLRKTVRLCYEAIVWGASDFFGESGSILPGGLPGLTGSLPHQ